MFDWFSLSQSTAQLALVFRPRSRSRDIHDNGPMWGHPEPDRPHNPDRTLVWSYTPALRRITRRICRIPILVDITQIRRLMEEKI